MKSNLVILTGSELSKEIGLEQEQYWRGYSINQFYSIEAWKHKPQRVLDYCNYKRKEIIKIKPNKIYNTLNKCQNIFNVTIITENIDDIHEKSGIENVIHLNGEILKARSSRNLNNSFNWSNNITLRDKDELGFQLRPHIVLHGEKQMYIKESEQVIKEADILIVIGNIDNNLMYKSNKNCRRYILSNDIKSKPDNFHIINKNISTAIPELVNSLLFK